MTAALRVIEKDGMDKSKALEAALSQIERERAYCSREFFASVRGCAGRAGRELRFLPSTVGKGEGSGKKTKKNDVIPSPLPSAQLLLTRHRCTPTQFFVAKMR